jgi:hypothetical protein
MKSNLFIPYLYEEANLKIKNCPDLRVGQSLMNSLYEINKELYDTITNTEYDPFYVDIKIPLFEDRLTQLLDKDYI